MRNKLMVCAGLLCFAESIHAQTSAPVFRHVASYRALGGLMASTVAPGVAAGSERIYASYLYDENTLDVIGVDPANGVTEVFHSVVPGEYGARNIAVGPDGDVYLGTLPHAHFIKIDRAKHTMVDLGRPSPHEEYIWDVAYGSDKRLYGVTYPGCRLVRYDPATGKMDDLGRMDATEKYGRWIVGGQDRYMYIGIGTAKANLAVFDTTTGELREILPKEFQQVGIVKPYIGADGKTYATLDDHLFAVDGFSVREINAKDPVPAVNHDVLRNGTVLTLTESGAELTEKTPVGQLSEQRVGYDGEPMQVFRLGMGPDGVLYGSSILPIHFFRVDEQQGKTRPIGDLGGGEFYSFLAHDGKLLMGAYSGKAPLMSYSPKEAFAPGENGNPTYVTFAGSDHAWRPQSMIEGPDGRVYVGATAGYGKTEGPLVSWTGKPGSVEEITGLVRDESVVSLAATKMLVIGGTTTLGGGGSHPTATDAHVFGWDPRMKKKVFDVIPVPGAKTVTDLVVSAAGVIYGIAIEGADHTLFALSAADGKVLSANDTGFRNVVYNGIGKLEDGTIVGLASTGVFAIDEQSGKVKMIAPSQFSITGGFALRGDTVFLVANSEVYSIDLKGTHAR